MLEICSLRTRVVYPLSESSVELVQSLFRTASQHPIDISPLIAAWKLTGKFNFLAITTAGAFSASGSEL